MTPTPDIMEKARELANKISRNGMSQDRYDEPFVNDFGVHLIAAALAEASSPKNLEDRDNFIVSKGLWNEFVASLPSIPLAEARAVPDENWFNMATKLHSYIMKRHNYGRGVREVMRLELNNEYKAMIAFAPGTGEKK